MKSNDLNLVNLIVEHLKNRWKEFEIHYNWCLIFIHCNLRYHMWWICHFTRDITGKRVFNKGNMPELNDHLSFLRCKRLREFEMQMSMHCSLLFHWNKLMVSLSCYFQCNGVRGARLEALFKSLHLHRAEFNNPIQIWQFRPYTHSFDLQHY